MTPAALDTQMTWALRAWERAGPRLPAIAATVFTVLLAVQLADAAWRLVPAPASAEWQPTPALAVAADANARKSDIGAIVSAHLFGIYAPTAAPAAAPSRDVPDTPLNLTLMGILAGTPVEYSRALIAHQGGDENPYAIGDRISDGVVLQKIMTDRVMLLRNGQQETLRLDKDKPSTATVQVAVNEPLADATASLSRVRDEVLRDPSKAGEYVRMQPAMVDGQLRGYRVYPGKDRTLFNTSGLRPGDLITSANGVELNDPGRALQLLGQLAQAPGINLVIDRGGQQQTLNLNLN